MKQYRQYSIYSICMCIVDVCLYKIYIIIEAHFVLQVTVIEFFNFAVSMDKWVLSKNWLKSIIANQKVSAVFYTLAKAMNFFI